LSVQLMLTFFVVLPMYIHKKYIMHHSLGFLIPSVVLMFGLLIAMFFSTGYLKLLMSFLFSLATGLMIGTALVNYNVDVLMQTTLITLGTTLFCTIFVYISKIDLHSWKGILSTYLRVTVLSGLVFILIPVTNLLHIIYCTMGIILFIGYILYYIEIATGLYLDIINLFLYILELLGSDNGRE
jgi:FtsH-binding integral membrane protein